MIKKLADLKEVFVPFITAKVKGCTVIFLNEELSFGLGADDLISQYSYIVDPDFSSKDLSCDEANSEKVFFAERYGGNRIFTNGGGGRCGFDGIFQIKGIGPNKLLGVEVAPVDRSGVLSIESAIYEAIWSEIINFSLPYGAIRSVAVIDLGLYFDYENKKHRRGLLVRQPAVRPAHFLRAVYFKEEGSKAAWEDSVRVKGSIRRLFEFLPFDEDPGSESSVFELLSKGIVELSRRYAKQFAASRSKQIYHNNISASNLSLDGKWIDLSSAKIFTSVKGGDRLDIINFETENIQAIASLEAICYQLFKYSVIDALESQTLLKHILSSFSEEYDSELSFYGATKAGFSPSLLREVRQCSAYFNFSQALRKIHDFDSYLAEPISTGLGWKGYEHWGMRLYINLLKEVTCSVDQDYAFIKLSADWIRGMVSSYKDFFELIVELAIKKGITRNSLICGMIINIVRLNRSSEKLFSTSEGIYNISSSNPVCISIAYNDFIRSAISDARLKFQDELEFKVPFWRGEEADIDFDIISGRFCVSVIGCEKMLCLESLDDLDMCTKDIQSALSFYDDVWSEFYEKNI